MEKRFKNGLCLGKFMPIHNGHIYMIREAAKQCETVHVMVCSRVCEPIHGFKRFKWAKDIFKDDENIKVIHCEDENPQFPEEHPDFYKIWNESVYNCIDELDAVFASEDYVYPFAAILGVEPVMVDLTRRVYPVCATNIRRGPFDYWDFIPPNVKEEYRLKVAVVGPESSGKSTLCDKLAKHYDGIRVEEYGRWYTENKVPAKDLEPWHFEYIAGEHYQRMLAAEYEADRDGSKFVFMDTEAIVTRTFLSMYEKMHNWYKKEDNDVTLYMDKIEELMKLQIFGHGIGNRKGKVDLYLLMYPDLEWEDDGTRDFEDKEDRMNSFLRIKTQLDVNNCNYHIVMGKGKRRLRNAIKFISESEKDMREKVWH